jgi:hypothetical protein
MKAGSAATLILTLLLAYGGLYFALLALPGNWRLPVAAPSPGVAEPKFLEINGHWEVFPDYHGLPRALFAPLHALDRCYLRPRRWEGDEPKNREMDFDWMLKAVAP